MTPIDELPRLPSGGPGGLHAALVAAVLVAAAALAAVDPAESRLFPPCLFRVLTGFHCPGCGALRACHQLLTGHPLAAFQLNPLAFLLAPVALADLLRAASPSRPLRPPVLLGRPFMSWLLPGLVCAFWLGRNLPTYPFR